MTVSRFLWCGFILAMAGVSPPAHLRGQSLEESLAGLPGFQTRLLQRIEDWEARPSEVGFEAGPLREWSLVSYSRWELRGTRKWELTVWEMLDAQGAFGLFAEHRWRVGAGQGRVLSLSFDNLLSGEGLAFWRDRRFLLLKARGDGPAPGDDEWAATADAIAGIFHEPNLYPFSLVQLPLLDLDAESVRFYLGEAGLGRDDAFPKSLIGAAGFDKDAEVVSARYGPSKAPFFLFGFPTASLAEEGAAALNGALQSVPTPQGAFMKRSGLLVGVFLGPEEEARSVLEQLQYDAKVKWIYDRGLSEEERRRRRGEIVSFFGVVTSSILFTAFFAVTVMVAGLATGLIRYQILKRFPILTAKREMIRLDL